MTWIFLQQGLQRADPTPPSAPSQVGRTKRHLLRAGEGRSTGNSAWLELPVGALIPTPSCQASPPGLANAPSTSGSALQHLWDEREGEDGSDMEQL